MEGGFSVRKVVTLWDIGEIDRWSALGADVFLVHPEGLSCRTRKTFTPEEIRRILASAHARGKLVYAHLNLLVHEADLPAVQEWLSDFAASDLDAIVCFDLTVLALAAPLGLSGRIIYRPETMNTNSFEPWFFRKWPIRGLTLSKDLTLAELLEIAENHQGLEMSLVAHGHLFLSFSRRPLLRSYLEGCGRSAEEVLGDESFRLREKGSSAGHPVFEDERGTHVFRAKEIRSFDELRVLGPYLSDIFLEHLFLEDEEYAAALSAYADEGKETEYLVRFGESCDEGFYYEKALLGKDVKG